jgi:hypothetical protein
LREQKSWCGETHVQKAAYLLQEMVAVPLGFEFILYKHGPFSFDLRDELTAMRADQLIELQPQWPYGPRLLPTQQIEYIKTLCSKTLAKYDDRIAFVSDKMGGKNVADLERLATAFYVTQTMGAEEPTKSRAEELVRLKPHIKIDEALAAMEEMDGMMEKAREQIH